MSHNFHFTEEDWTRTEENWNAWWSGEIDRPMITIETIDDTRDWSTYDDFISHFPLGTPVDNILDYYQIRLEATHWIGDAYPKFWLNFGAGVTAAFLGSPVDHATGTTWFWPLSGIHSLSEIHPTYNSENPWWKHVLAVAKGAAERWGKEIAIGMIDLGGNLDILASLRGSEKLLVDLVEDSDEVDRLVAEITQLWLQYYNQVDAIISPLGHGSTCWGPMWAPTRGYMLQSDFCYMISPRMFRRYVLPDLVTLCSELDYPFYHLDGKGEIPHLDMLLGIEKLRGVQWQPGDGAPLGDQWLPLLKRIRDSGKLCQVYVKTEGAITIQRELGGKGFEFHIIETLTEEDARDFIRVIRNS